MLLRRLLFYLIRKVENNFFFKYNLFGKHMKKKKMKPDNAGNIKSQTSESMIPAPGMPFSSLFREVKDMIYRMSLPDGTYTYVSPASTSILGYTPEEFYLTPKLIREAIHPDWRGYFKEQWASLLAGNMPGFYEYQVITKTGKTKWLHQSNVLVKDINGTPVAIEGIVRDITDRKKAETEITEWKNRYEAAVMASRHILYDWDSVTDEVIYGGGLESILGFTHQEMVGGLATWQSLIHPDDVPHFQQVIAHIIKTKEPAYLGYRVRKKNGDYIHVEDSGRFFADSEGNIIRMVGFVKDISERKRAGEEKRKLEEQLRQSQKMQAIGTLAGGIAHDFNNILAVISGYSELSLQATGDTARLTGNLEHILESTRRAKELVDQILMFSRKKDVALKPLNPAAIVREAVSFIRSAIPTSIEIRSHIDDTEKHVLADSTQLQQVIINLCTNAAHAVKNNTGLIVINLKEIELCSHTAKMKNLSPGDYFQLTVTDDGTGIPEFIRGRIFEPYFTTKKAGKGSGLGLAVVHGIIKGHGGGISVYSEKEKGTTFSVFLPIVTGQVLQAEEAVIKEGIPGGTENILFVDDEKGLVNTAGKMLEILGYNVTARTDSIEALEEFKKNSGAFDLLITDMTMPYMTGLQLIGEIHKIRPGFPVILCTGFSDNINEENYRRFGINRFVMKPMTNKQISHIIRDVLDNR